ncbi:hypothetical protein D3C75_1236560 [compost metagenome]
MILNRRDDSTERLLDLAEYSTSLIDLLRPFLHFMTYKRHCLDRFNRFLLYRGY